MKKLLLPFLFILSSWGTSIDSTYYEGDLTTKYSDLATDLSRKVPSNEMEKSTLAFQKSLIKEIQSLVGQEMNPNTPNVEELGVSKISEKTFYRYFQSLVSVENRIDQMRGEQKLLNQKAVIVKERVEKMASDQNDTLVENQLQYALYKLQQGVFEKKIQNAHHEAQTLLLALHKALPKTLFSKNYVTTFEQYRQKFDQINSKIVALQMQKERSTVLGDAALERFDQEIGGLENEIKQLRLRQVDGLILHILYSVQIEDKKAIMHYSRELEETVASLKSDIPTTLIAQEIVQMLIKESLGAVVFALTDTQKSFQDSVQMFVGWMTEPLFHYNENPVSMIQIIKVLLIFVGGILLAQFYRKKTLQLTERWNKQTHSTIKLLSNLGYYVIVLITIITALSSAGIDLSSISLIAGALSIGIGFGLQTVVSNLVSGLILMFERSIRIGDMLEINNSLKGEVTDIRIRSTTIKTLDNVEIIVPNSTFIQNQIINWTLEDKVRRLHIPFSVAYGTNIGSLKQLVLDAIMGSGLIFIRDHELKKPIVSMVSMGANALEMEMLIWIDMGEKDVAQKSDFLVLIYETLTQSGISIPFPQLDVHLHQKA